MSGVYLDGFKGGFSGYSCCAGQPCSARPWRGPSYPNQTRGQGEQMSASMLPRWLLAVPVKRLAASALLWAVNLLTRLGKLPSLDLITPT